MSAVFERPRTVVFVGENMLGREEVRECLRTLDPLGLIKDGMPPDEYEPEVDDVYLLVKNRLVSRRSLRAVFESWFYPDAVSEEKLEAMVQALT